MILMILELSETSVQIGEVHISGIYFKFPSS